VRPESIETREEFSRALTELKSAAGLSIREIAGKSDASAATVGGWFSGQHAPQALMEDALRRVLGVLGVQSSDQAQWLDAAARARRQSPRKNAVTASPYRGFTPFDVDDHAVFFGRADVTDLVIETVLEQAERPTAIVTGIDRLPVVTLVGPSGAGKSSVLRAGLLAQIGREGPFEEWRYVVFTPGADPAGSFRSAVADLPDGDGPVLVAVDQFEEMYTVNDVERRRALIDALAEFTASRRDPTFGVMTIRADFYGVLAENPRAARALQNATVLVPALDHGQLRDVIVGPAGVAGIRVSDDLVDLLIADLRPGFSGAGLGSALPLLSHALLSTWTLSNKRVLTVADYVATGRIRGAVEQTAERVYGELDYAEKVVARRQLLAMTMVDDDITSRRRAPLAELGVPPPEKPDDKRDVRERRAAGVLDRFASARLVSVSETHAEIAHEALLSAWPRLMRWIDEDRDQLLIARRLQAAVDLWVDGDEASELLPLGGRLDLFVEFADSPENATRVTAEQRRFLDRAAARRDEVLNRGRRQARRMRLITVAACLFAVVALVAAGLAVVARSEAVSQRNAAERSRLDATSARLANVADEQRLRNPALALQLALVAYRLAPTIEARSALLDLTSGPVPARRATAGGGVGLAVSPDATLIAAGSSDHRVRLFRLTPNGLSPSIAVVGAASADERLLGVKFSPDGSTLWAAGTDGLSAWDIRDPARPRALSDIPRVTTSITDLAVDPSGTVVAVALDGPGVEVYRRDPSGRWTPLAVPPQFTGSATMVAFSRDGRILASASALQRVDISAVEGDAIRPLSAIPLPGASNISADDGDFSPATGELALALKSRDIKTYSMSDPTRPVQTADYTDFGSYVNGVAYSADGTRLVGSSSDDTARVYDLVNKTPPQALRVGNTVSQAAFAGNTVVTSGGDGAVAVWPARQYSVQAGPKNTFQFAFQADGPRFTVSTSDAAGAFSQWRIDPAAGLQRAGPNVSPPPGVGFTALDMTRDARLVAVGTVDGRMYLADVSDPTKASVISPPIDITPGDLIETVAVSGETDVAIAGSSLSTTLPVVDVSDPRAPRTTASLDLGDGIAWASMAPDGRLAVVSTVNGFLDLIDVSDRSRPRVLSKTKVFESGALASRFSPDQKRIVVSSAINQVRLLDITNPTAPRTLADLTGPTGSVFGATFSRDGMRVAAGGADGRLWIWDVRDPGNVVATGRLQAFPGRIYDVQFGPGDRQVLATGAAGVVGSWNTDVAGVVDAACRIDTDPISRDEWSLYVPGLAYQPPCR
jgi:WD40 repeat protein/transcriptional regulator with XRE-family HTH domain